MLTGGSIQGKGPAFVRAISKTAIKELRLGNIRPRPSYKQLYQKEERLGYCGHCYTWTKDFWKFENSWEPIRLNVKIMSEIIESNKVWRSCRIRCQAVFSISCCPSSGYEHPMRRTKHTWRYKIYWWSTKNIWKVYGHVGLYKIIDLRVDVVAIASHTRMNVKTIQK